MFEEVSLMQWLVVAAVFLVLAIWAGFRPVLDLFGGQFRKPNSVKMPFGRFRGRQGVEFEYTGWKNKDSGMPTGILKAGDYIESVDWDELLFPPAAVAPMNTEAFDIVMRNDKLSDLLRENEELKYRIAVARTTTNMAFQNSIDFTTKMMVSMGEWKKSIGNSGMPFTPNRMGSSAWQWNQQNAEGGEGSE
jgi:hypothetical protein